MPSFRFSISPRYRKELEQQLRRAQQLGDLRRTKYLLAILAVMDGQSARGRRRGAQASSCQMLWK